MSVIKRFIETATRDQIDGLCSSTETLFDNVLNAADGTNIVSGRADRIHKMAPGPNRERERSRTYQGIADAMAARWVTS